MSRAIRCGLTVFLLGDGSTRFAGIAGQKVQSVQVPLASAMLGPSNQLPYLVLDWRE